MLAKTCLTMNDMPQNDLAALLDRIGWSARELSSRTGIPQHRIGRWVTGVNARGNPCLAPDEVVAWLEMVAWAIERVKAPEVKR